jgi:CheY-like chemotaxis protein
VLGGASAARAGAGRASRTGLAARPVNVLLAEDNVVNQRVAVGLLTRRGHRVTVAGNGLEVLEAMERDSYDVVLMDVQMPEMGGLEATQAIRVREEATGRRVRIVAMTAHAMAGDRERCLAAGMDGYLAKPVEPAALFAAVEQRDVETTRTAAPALSPVVDRASLIERLGGDEALLREVIKLFQGDCPVRLAALKAAVDGRDADRIRTEAHALKGAAANLSAAGLAEAAATLERIGAENRLAAAEAAWRRLSGEATAVLDVLRRFERARTVVG